MEHIIYGTHPVLETLKNHPEQVLQILLPEGGLKDKKRQILSLARQHNIKVRFLPPHRLDSLAGKQTHQGVIGIVSPHTYAPLDSLVNAWKSSGEKALFVLLDGVEDPRNFGAIIRTATTVGAHGIIVPKHRSAPLNSAAAKTAAGALPHMPICRVTNLVSLIGQLKNLGVWVAGTEEAAPRHLYDSDFTVDLAVIIGGEGKGVRPLVKKECDFLVSIPAPGPIRSLNASAAASVVLYEIVRQRYYVR
ncbi:MAG: 23S rRNA (guanosine(2251)-2'-O)-methyltransferase RlmB [Deltaproteobacteria bacterium]|nr:23S rRNA (guanosine(2251)-2'-O)-methyltransferase RlmB [Deltaproteobacteria bacterium]